MGIIEDGKRHHLHYKGISRSAAEDVKRYGDFRQLDRELAGVVQKEPKKQSDENFSVLIFQAGKGNLPEVERLLAGGAYDVNQQRYKNGYTALHAAAEGGHAAVVETLLAAGAEPKILNSDHHTAYALAKGRHNDVAAVFDRHEAGLELIAAAESGNSKKVGSLLSQYAFTDRNMLEEARKRAGRNDYDGIADALSNRIAALPAPASRTHGGTTLASYHPDPAAEPKKGNWLWSILGAAGVGAVSLLTGGLGLIPTLLLVGGVGLAIYYGTKSAGKPSPSADTAAIPPAVPGNPAQNAADQYYMQTQGFEVPSVPNANAGKPPAAKPPGAKLTTSQHL